MGHLPLVSIVTPSLNQGRFIEATIQSVLAQDYPRIEHIVMDGGSTDGTLDVLRRYEGRLRWISEPDRGQSDAINKGFRLANGEILAWLNSDDTYLPGAVSAAVEHFVQHPECGMVYGEGYLIDETGAVIHRFPATEPFNLWKLVYVLDYILQQTVFMRRHVLDAVGEVDERLHWGMDWDLFIRIGKRFRVDYIPTYMANLREYPTAKTFSGGRTRFRELVTLMRRHGGRRFPPAYVAYGLDTYMQLAFGAIEHALPARLMRPFRRLQRIVQRPFHGVIRRFCKSQGVYADGWVAGRSHFLLPCAADATTLSIRGSRPPLRRHRGSMLLTAIVDSVALPTREVAGGADFEVSWPLPAASREQALIEVDVICRPTFRHGKTAAGPDPRRLSFLLKAISVA